MNDAADSSPRRRRRQTSVSVPRTLTRGWKTSPALATVSLAPLMAALTFGPTILPTIFVCVLVALFAMGWLPVTGLSSTPAHQVRSIITIALWGAAAAVAVHAFGDMALATSLFGFAIISAFLLEFLRDPRPGLTASVATNVTALMLVVAGSSWAALAGEGIWKFLMLPAGLLLGVAALSWFVPGSMNRRAAVAVGGAMLAGVAYAAAVIWTGLATTDPFNLAIHAPGFLAFPWRVNLLIGLLLGLVAGMIVALVQVVFAGRSLRTWWERLAVGITPVLVMGMPAYVLARILGS